MNDALCSFIYTLRADPHPTPDYRVIHSPRDLYSYLQESDADIDYVQPIPIAEDTESLPDGSPYCLTFSTHPGTGRLIYSKDTHLIEEFKQALGLANYQHIFHNYLHDIAVFDQLGISVPHTPTHFQDTMVRAYHLCLGGGGDDEGEGMAGRGSLSLKALAYRHLCMQMESFKGTVYPHSLPLLLSWLHTARALLKPDDWVPGCVCGHPKTSHEQRGKTQRHTGPCIDGPLGLCPCTRFRKAPKPKSTPDDGLYRKLHNLITKTERGELAMEEAEGVGEVDGEGGMVGGGVDGPLDPWKAVRNWKAEELGMLEGLLSPIPIPSIAHVPEKDLLVYAVRDADATLRLHHYLSNLRPWIFY